MFCLLVRFHVLAAVAGGAIKDSTRSATARRFQPRIDASCRRIRAAISLGDRGDAVRILLTSLLDLLPPLLLRDLIDNALPQENSPGDLRRLTLLGIGMVLLPVISGLVGIWQRRVSSVVGEGIIYDLRLRLSDDMQRMGGCASLRIPAPGS